MFNIRVQYSKCIRFLKINYVGEKVALNCILFFPSNKQIFLLRGFTQQRRDYVIFQFPVVSSEPVFCIEMKIVNETLNYNEYLINNCQLFLFDASFLGHKYNMIVLFTVSGETEYYIELETIKLRHII